MAIKTGIGVGAAQVFDTSGIMNTYARQQAQQQKIQAAQAQREFLSAEKATVTVISKITYKLAKPKAHLPLKITSLPYSFIKIGAIKR
jgi:hypothetical protein